jgi:2,4-dienoyl-CoA reductase-like NADH-dependent reductase (Old Yellow Enzyme family)
LVGRWAEETLSKLLIISLRDLDAASGWGFRAKYTAWIVTNATKDLMSQQSGAGGEVSHLFAPLTIREVAFRNRIGVSPMCEYSSARGFANDWHLVHLGSRAVGGAAMVMTEAAAVTDSGRISPRDLGIWLDDHIPMLARIFRFIEDQGAVPAMQLAHAGRKASTAPPWEGGGTVGPEKWGWKRIFAPSAIPFSPASIVPEALDERGIASIVQAFAEAARRACETGAKVIEIHSAHGYLLHEFLSPLSNQRTDCYGGSFENRTRFLREVVHAVRQTWPASFPLFVRISATDWTEGGWTIEDSVELAKQLGPLGVDLIDCSSGGIVPGVTIPVAPGYQVPFAEQIRKQARIATAAVGMITEPAQAEQIIRGGQADMVFLARELLRDPYWPLRTADHFKLNGPWPKQYLRAKRT